MEVNTEPSQAAARIAYAQLDPAKSTAFQGLLPPQILQLTLQDKFWTYDMSLVLLASSGRFTSYLRCLRLPCQIKSSQLAKLTCSGMD